MVGLQDLLSLSPSEVVSIVLSVLSLVISIYTFKKNVEFKSYSDIDSLYMDALKLALDHPEFRDPEKTSRYKEAFTDKKQLLAYETYAYIVWNICETVYDRDEDKKTWYPVIDAERRLHLAWFSNPENHHKFKKEFRDFIQNEFDAALQRTASGE